MNKKAPSWLLFIVSFIFFGLAGSVSENWFSFLLMFHLYLYAIAIIIFGLAVVTLISEIVTKIKSKNNEQQ